VSGLANSLSTFPSFAAYFIGGVILIAVFLALYANLTPHREFALIREGNTAAAIALAGGLLGFVVPLASVIAHSAGLIDLLVWGTIALIIQLAGFMVARLVIPGLPQAVEAGKVSDAIFLAALSLALGLLDAACMAG
jgi:putative membrane protein